jgi:phosphatidylserine/phosphatidylglycerophosphate/cardiolipin synthase-like enzyme
MSTFCNNILCDIYIGQGSGKKLMSDLNNAQKSIKIVSPFISPDLLDMLVHKHRQGIDVQLIFMLPERNDNELGKALIKRNVVTNHSAQLKKQKLEKYSNLLWYIQIAVIFLFIAVFIYVLNTKYNAYAVLPIIIGILFRLIIRKKRLSLKNEANRVKIFEYSYSEILPFKAYINRTYDDYFIHSKIFIIDDSIAYLGSLNFTWNGTQNNHETRVRTIDKTALSKMIVEFDELYYSPMTCASIDFWGSRIYPEPIN